MTIIKEPIRNKLTSQGTFNKQVILFGLAQFFIRGKYLIVFPILSRQLGAQGYGVLGVITAFAGMLMNVMNFGVNTSLTVFIPTLSKDKKQAEFWYVFQVATILSTLLSAILLFLSSNLKNRFFPNLPSEFTLVLGILIAFFQSANSLFLAQLVSIHQAGAYSKIMAISSIIEIIITIFGSFQFGVKGVLIALLISQLIQSVFLVLALAEEGSIYRITLVHFSNTIKYFSYGFLLCIIGVLSWVLDSGDRLLMSKYLSLESIGVYQVSYGLCTQLYYLTAPLFVPLLPLISKSISENRIYEAQADLERVFKTLLLILVPAILFLCFGATDLLELLSTKEFTQQPLIIPFMAAKILFFQFATLYSYQLHAYQKGKYLLIALGIAAFLNIIMNLLFLPKYGVIAASASSLLSYIVFFLISKRYAEKNFKLKIETNFILKLIVQAIVISVVVLFVRTWFMKPLWRMSISTAVGSVIGLGMTLVLGLLSQYELEAISKIRERFSVNLRTLRKPVKGSQA